MPSAGKALLKQIERKVREGLTNRYEAEGLAEELRSGREMYRAVSANKASTARARALSRVWSRPTGGPTASEPAGLYFTPDLKILPELVFGQEYLNRAGLVDRSAPEAVTTYIRRAGEAGASFNVPGKIYTKIIKARLRPEARLLDAGTPKRWINLLEEFIKKHPKEGLVIRANVFKEDIPWEVLASKFRGKDPAAEASKKLTKWLKQKHQADAVLFPDIVIPGQETFPQVTVLRRGAVEARLGGKQKLLGAAISAGLGAGLLGKDQEAQAQPVGVFQKVVSKAARGALSSASKVLEGQEIEGRVIKEVRKGRGKWRSILFDDGTEMVVDKQRVNDLCRAFGTHQKIQEFNLRKGEDKTLQALKSLDYHYKRSRSVPRDLTRKYHKEYLTRGYEVSPAVPPGSHFVHWEGRYFSMPKEYAEHLEQMGYIKILRGKRDIQASRPGRPKRRKR